MSYILDALKKAEQERGSEQVPNLMTVHDFRSKSRNPSRLLIAVLALSTAALLLYLLPALRTVVRHPAAGTENRPGPALPSAAAVDGSRAQATTASAEKAAPVSKIRSKGTPPSTIGSQKAASNQGTAPPTSPQPAAQQNGPKPAFAGPALTTPPPPPAAKSTNPAGIEPNPAPPASPAKPASLSEAMALMNLSVVLYSDVPAERIVFINGRKYVEGDRIDGKYLVESITLEGAVLSYQGERATLRPRQK